jgi:hypothetical protein
MVARCKRSPARYEFFLGLTILWKASITSFRFGTGIS